jgi:MFS family permease
MSKLSLRSPTTMLAAGAVVLTLSLGVRHAFGLFMAPMGTEQGIGREAFGLAIALQNLVWGLAQPFAGRLADRVGAARAVLVGGLLYALGLALMARSTDALSLSLSAGLVIGLALSGTTFPVVFGAIARAMPPEKRSMAMGVAMSVGSLGQFADRKSVV